MKKLILIQVVLLSISGISCESAPTNTNTSVNRMNATNLSNMMPTPPANQSNIAENTRTNNATTTNVNLQIKNGQVSPKPTPTQAAEKRDESLFSFPPPRVVDFFEINHQQLLNQEGQTTLSDVSQKLATGLKNAGYSNGKYAYFWNNDDEFAIITAMERINADGTPFTNDMRWENLDNLQTAQNFSEYVKYLISGKKIYYRVFAFVVTNKEYAFFDNSPPSFSMAKKWMRRGKPELSAGGTSTIRDVPFDEQYHCYALLYLFVNHSSLDNPKPVDDEELKGSEKGLKNGLNQNPENHLQQTRINFGG
ncbi:MAG: hypothetical protein M3Q33_03360 [Acidobacteriota bacterium]|nr:hypothetical protein [Acidobacteriota bacterium]